MNYPYDEMYLSDAQKNLGFFFQTALCNLCLSADEVQKAFLDSIIPEQIQFGNPDFLCGKSGFELLYFAFDEKKYNLKEKIKEALQEPFYPQAEYWCGFVLAYTQWKNNFTFKQILENFDLSRLLSNYHLMHEADISKIDEMIAEEVKKNRLRL